MYLLSFECTYPYIWSWAVRRVHLLRLLRKKFMTFIEIGRVLFMCVTHKSFITIFQSLHVITAVSVEWKFAKCCITIIMSTSSSSSSCRGRFKTRANRKLYNTLRRVHTVRVKHMFHDEMTEMRLFTENPPTLFV